MACSLKEAALAADIGLLERAVSVFESAGRSDAAESSRRFNVKEHLFKAGLARLAMDVCMRCAHM